MSWIETYKADDCQIAEPMYVFYSFCQWFNFIDPPLFDSDGLVSFVPVSWDISNLL